MSQFPATSAFRSKDANNVAYPNVVGVASLRAFNQVPYDGIVERIIANPGATGKLYVRLVDALERSTDTPVNIAAYTVAPGAASPAAITGIDSGPAVALTGIPINPGGMYVTSHTGTIEIISDTAASPVTLKER